MICSSAPITFPLAWVQGTFYRLIWTVALWGKSHKSLMLSLSLCWVVYNNRNNRLTLSASFWCSTNRTFSTLARQQYIILMILNPDISSSSKGRTIAAKSLLVFDLGQLLWQFDIRVSGVLQDSSASSSRAVSDLGSPSLRPHTSHGREQIFHTNKNFKFYFTSTFQLNSLLILC